MKILNNKIKSTIFIFTLVFLTIVMYYFLTLPKENNNVIQNAGLIIYTPLSSNLYLPIIKEFQERNNVYVKIMEESEDTIINQLKDISLFDADVIFDGNVILGIHNDSIKENEDLFTEHRPLNSIPFVIAFNNHLLTSQEQIESYNSLTKSGLKGKIGFVDPNSSPVYAKILNMMALTTDNPPLFKKLFIENTKDYYLNSTEDINLALQNGTISVGITNIQSALLLSSESSNINYLHKYKYDCILNFDIALPKETNENEIALTFFEFVQSNDVKQFISSYLNSDIGGKAYGLD